MFFRRVLDLFGKTTQEIFQTGNNPSEEEAETDSDPAPHMVDLGGQETTPQEESVKTYIESSVEAWKQIFEELHGVPPSDSEVESAQLITEYAFSEVSGKADTIRYLCGEMMDLPAHLVPDWAIRMVSVAIMEYVSGNMQMIQTINAREE